MTLQAPVKKEFYEVEEHVRALFSTNISVAATDPTEPRSAAYPEEAACLPPMRALRRREFLAGRDALRQAIVGLGHAPCAIPMQDNRAPVFPAGIQASLSHTAQLCIAIADFSHNSISLGIDIELSEALDPALWSMVLTRDERLWMADQPKVMQGIAAKTIFCAKEAAYKCQFALSGALLDFDAFDVTFGEDDRFTATFRQTVGPFSASDQISGRIEFVADHIVAVARIPA